MAAKGERGNLRARLAGLAFGDVQRRPEPLDR
jgi:hypothetical protein